MGLFFLNTYGFLPGEHREHLLEVPKAFGSMNFFGLARVFMHYTQVVHLMYFQNVSQEKKKLKSDFRAFK